MGAIKLWWNLVLSIGMALDPWRSLRAPLLLPWETGFFREMLHAGEGRVDTEAGLPEVVEKYEAVTAELGDNNKRKVDEDELTPTEVAWDPDEIARAQDKLDDDERASLVAEFASWVRTSDRGSELQRQMNEEMHEQDQISMVGDALVERATGTLRVRVGALRRLQQAIGVNPLDCSEEVLYKELCRLRKLQVAPSRGVGYLQALRFGMVVSGSCLAGPVLTSKRLVGAAYGPWQGKALKQRSALTLRQLIALENYVTSVASMHEAAIGGHLLFCLYAQARWSDSQYLEDAPKMDVENDGPGVIEATTRKSKGHKGLKRLRMRTPVVALAYSASGKRWWSSWARARSTLRLPHSPALPAIKADGSLGKVAMSSSAAAQWLKVTLAKLNVPELPGRDLGSHSCRATLQSWLARWGMAPSSRRALAHHLKPGDKMPLVYSRDYLVGPLGGVVRMLSEIRQQEWDPDNARTVLLKAALGKKDYGGASGSILGHLDVGGSVDKSNEATGTDKKEAVVNLDDEAGRDTDVGNPIEVENDAKSDAEGHTIEIASSGVESSSDDEFSDEVEYDIVDELSAVIDEEGGPYVNTKSGFVHEVGPGDKSTRCGIVPIGYRKLADLSEGSRDGAVFCRKCYKGLTT